jgi:hypothetical protein
LPEGSSTSPVSISFKCNLSAAFSGSNIPAVPVSITAGNDSFPFTRTFTHILPSFQINGTIVLFAGRGVCELYIEIMWAGGSMPITGLPSAKSETHNAGASVGFCFDR